MIKCLVFLDAIGLVTNCENNKHKMNIRNHYISIQTEKKSFLKNSKSDYLCTDGGNQIKIYYCGFHSIMD